MVDLLLHYIQYVDRTGTYAYTYACCGDDKLRGALSNHNGGELKSMGGKFPLLTIIYIHYYFIII